MEDSLLLGVLTPVDGGFYFGGLLSGVARVAAAEGCRVIAVQTWPAALDRGEERDPPPFDLPVAARDIDGYIAITTAVSRGYLEALRTAGHPVVLLSGEIEGFEAPVAMPDNHRGIHHAVDHLFAHGHRRIGFAGNLRQPDMRERHAAYEDAMLSHGITPDPTWFFEAADNEDEGGPAAARRLLEAGLPTTGLIVATDRTAIGLMDELEAAGLKLPDDQAIIGFDNAEFAAGPTPRLSTVDQHVDRVGELAARLLLALLRGEHVEPSRHRVPASLVLRESCGCTTARPDFRGDGSSAGESARERFIRRARDVVPTSSVCRSAEDGAAKHERIADSLDLLADAVEAAAAGSLADSGVLARLVDEIFVDEPKPETAERLLVAVRSFESDLSSAIPLTRRLARQALHDTVTDTALAVMRAQARAELRRDERTDIALAAQHNLDMDLLRPGRADPRRLDWLPRSAVTSACLALWTDESAGKAERILRIAGVYDSAGALQKTIGNECSTDAFPPQQLWLGAGVADIVHVVPVSMEHSERGLLAVLAPVESHAVRARGSYHHWAAVLAVALDQEETLSTLRRHRVELEQSYQRERELVCEIRGSEQRYALAARAVDDGLWDWDVSSGVVYYSPRWKSMLGYLEDGIGARPGEWLDRIHPEDRDAVAAAIADQLSGGQTPFRVTHRLRTADGTYRWLLSSAVTVLDDAGIPARMVGVIREMTPPAESPLGESP